MAKERLYSAEASRRCLLRDFARAAVGVTFASEVDNACAAKPKKSKAHVDYQDFPHGIERCEICAPFLPPDQCKTVVGPGQQAGLVQDLHGDGMNDPRNSLTNRRRLKPKTALTFPGRRRGSKDIDDLIAYISLGALRWAAPGRRQRINWRAEVFSGRVFAGLAGRRGRQ